MSHRRFTANDAARILRALPAASTQDSGPEQLLTECRMIRREVANMEEHCVTLCLQQGMSFAGIAEHLGVTRQNIHQRYRHLQRNEPITTN